MGKYADVWYQSGDGLRSRKADLQVAQIPRRGHSPTLTEPESTAAIDVFLSQL